MKNDSKAVKKERKIEVEPITEKWTKFHEIEKYFSDKYDLRFNIIANDIEIKLKNKNEWKSCNADSLFVELHKKSIPIGRSSVISILKSDFVPEYNILVEYFENLPKWNGETDYITEFSRFVKLNENEDIQQFEYHFKKWCVRAVKCATIDGYFNKQAFILSDNAIGQNIGKTSYLNFLCPPALSNFIRTDLPKDTKDEKISLATNFLINVDELANLSKKDTNSLKSLFSITQIKDRLPYGSKDSIIQRVASFIGSTNNVTFLGDETGSVRWLCFTIHSIDFSYRQKFNINNLWAQAYTLSNNENFDENMTKKDIIDNETRNEKFQIQTTEKDLVNKYFGIPAIGEVEYFTATDIMTEITKYTILRLSSVMIGKALTSLKFKRVKHKDTYCYEVLRRYKDLNNQ